MKTLKADGVAEVNSSTNHWSTDKLGFIRIKVETVRKFQRCVGL